MLKKRLKAWSRSLDLILTSVWSKRLFVLLLLLGLITSVLFHKSPLLVIFTFAAWTTLAAVTFALKAAVQALNRQVFSAVLIFLWSFFLFSLGYIVWKLLIEEAF
jgi:hypothetical protein